MNNGIRMSVFYEPDINEYTSVAIEPGEKSRKLTSSLPLMLKENKEIDDYISKSMAILTGMMKDSPYEKRAEEQIIKQGNRLLEEMN